MSVSMPCSGDGVFNEGRGPRIVRPEQRELIRRGLAASKRVLNGIASKPRVPGVHRPTGRLTRIQPAIRSPSVVYPAYSELPVKASKEPPARAKEEADQNTQIKECGLRSGFLFHLGIQVD